MLDPRARTLLALTQITGVGPKTILKLSKRFADLDECFRLDATQLREAEMRPAFIAGLEKVAWQRIDSLCAWGEAHPSQHVISWEHEAYPRRLREIATPPPVLFVRGQLSVLSLPAVGVVGSRRPTPQGQENAHQFSFALAEQGIAVASGLARGIDGASHRGALAAKGVTVAVLGSGCDRIYPREHQALAAQIIERGAIVSEYAPDVGPKGPHFPQRNRIISGMSLGVLVVEAALKSGSLITAQHALEQGREVFAVPGAIQNPMVAGCHALIQQGAKCVAAVTDILDELGFASDVENNLNNRGFEGLDETSQRVLAALGFDFSTVDMILHRSGLSAEEVVSCLTQLELRGQVMKVPGGYVKHPEG